MSRTGKWSFWNILLFRKLKFVLFVHNYKLQKMIGLLSIINGGWLLRFKFRTFFYLFQTIAKV